VSGTSFAIWASVVGLGLSWAGLGATLAVPVESPELIIALFIGIFVAFFTAVWSHPKREVHGGGVSIGWLDVIKTAPPWSTALVVVTLAAMFVAGAMVPESKFSITRAALTGRPDRVRLCFTFCAAFYAFSLHTALSARALRARLGLPWMKP
jgi:hypothetical protein